MELYGHFDETMKGIFYSPASLENLNPFRGAVLDGELLVLDEDKATLLDRKTGNGILNKAVKGTISKEEADRVVMVVWDMIPVNDFREGHSDIAYHDRMGVLSERMEEVENTFEFPLIRLVQIFRVNDYDDAKLLFDMLITGGQEGLILKNEDMPWEDKRSKYQVKMKVELSAELLVTEWNEGTGRIEGLMGSVTCVDANGNLEVNVGSGFNDEDRTMVAEDIVGKIITVKYNEVIQAKEKDKKSLFLPIFEEIRLDKDVADKF
jgi:ATP-dependent DNA ligase